MKFVILSACLILLTSCASTDERLLGTWKSNRDLTLADFRTRKPVSPESAQTISNIFGSLIVTYKGHTVYEYLPPSGSDTDAWTRSSSYRVAARDSDSVAIVSENVITGTPEITHIHFESPTRFWIYLGSSGNREFFDKTPEPDAAPEPPPAAPVLESSETMNTKPKSEAPADSGGR